MLDMNFHGALADTEGRADFSVRSALHDLGENLLLTAGENAAGAWHFDSPLRASRDFADKFPDGGV